LAAVVVITLRRWQQRRNKGEDSLDDSTSMGSSYAGTTLANTNLVGSSRPPGAFNTITSP